jgi:integrase
MLCRDAVAVRCPKHWPEFMLSLNTGLRLSEQYGLRWEDVSFARRSLTARRSKNGAARHVRLNQAALAALQSLRKLSNDSEFVLRRSEWTAKLV